MCLCGGMGHLPVVLALIMVVTLATTYIIAVYHNDISPVFPYISDVATHRPESSIFGQLLNFCSFLSFLIMYLRYRLIREFNRGSDRFLKNINNVAFLIGTLSAFGVSLVANFQETSVIVVHIVGALGCFIGAIIYELLNAYISYRMHPLYNGILICHIRLACALFSLAVFILSFALEEVARQQYNASGMRKINIFHWDKNDPVLEWMLSLSFLLYFFTYIKDFDKLRVNVEVLPLVSHLDEVPVPSLNDATRLLV